MIVRGSRATEKMTWLDAYRLTPRAIGPSESAGGPVLAGLEVGSALKRLCFPVPCDGETVAVSRGVWPGGWQSYRKGCGVGRVT